MLCICASAQSPTGSIGGIVFDPDAKVIAGAEIVIVNDLTRVQYETKTNSEGIYAVPNLPPGPYRVQVSKVGFKTLIKPDIILNVQDAITLNFTLPVGAESISVTVEGGSPVRFRKMTFPASMTIRTGRRSFALSLNSPIASPSGIKGIIARLMFVPRGVRVRCPFRAESALHVFSRQEPRNSVAC